MYCLLSTKSQVSPSEIDDLVINLNAKAVDHYYKGRLGNLRIYINPDGTYCTKGSIWKYAKGNNITPFSHEDFLATINELDSLTFGTYSLSEVIGYEFGINIKTYHDPAHYRGQIATTKLNNRHIALNQKYKKNDLWVRRSPGSVHRFKCYNKKLESGINENLLRLEYFVKNTKMLLGRSLQIEELKSPQFIAKQYKLIKSFTKELIFSSEYDPTLLSSLKTQDKWRYLAYMNSNIQNPQAFVKSMGFDANTKSRENRALMKILSGTNYDHELRKEIITKADLLLN